MDRPSTGSLVTNTNIMHFRLLSCAEVNFLQLDLVLSSNFEFFIYLFHSIPSFPSSISSDLLPSAVTSTLLQLISSSVSLLPSDSLH